MKPALLFDQDGTLFDSGPGIFNCLKITLDELKVPYDKNRDMRFFYGPPLEVGFRLAGVPEELIPEAVRIYRVHYKEIGVFDGLVYQEIPEILCKAKELGIPLIVCTSKKHEISVKALEHFDLFKYFDRIYGALPGHAEKELLVEDALKELKGDYFPIMIGDTFYDIIGGKKNGIATIGVTWGYGKIDAMEKENPDAIISSPDELLDKAIELMKRAQ